jgi:hypothetical protein
MDGISENGNEFSGYIKVRIKVRKAVQTLISTLFLGSSELSSADIREQE